MISAFHPFERFFKACQQHCKKKTRINLQIRYIFDVYYLSDKDRENENLPVHRDGMRSLERNSEVGEMELRDPYEVNYAGQRRQSAQLRNAQVNRQQREGVQLRNAQAYRQQRDGVQLRNAQAYRQQRDGVQSHNAQVNRQQRERAQSHSVQVYSPQREGTQSRNVQVYNPQREGTSLRNTPVYRPPSSTQNHFVQNRRAAVLRRRTHTCRQILVAAALTLVIAGLGCMLLIMCYQAVAAEPKPHEIPYRNSAGTNVSMSYEDGLIQGIPAVEFAKYLKMEESFLTLNDYSSPGEAMTEVKKSYFSFPC